MTKEITKAFILQQIRDKFKLRELTPEKFSFSEMVMPVYNIEQHLEEWWHKYYTVTVTATGAKEFVGVPENERWHLRRYDVVFMTGAFTIAGIFILRKNKNPVDAYVYLDLTAAQNVSYHVETDVVLTHGDAIRVNIDGFTSSGDIRLYIDYKREIIR